MFERKLTLDPQPETPDSQTMLSAFQFRVHDVELELCLGWVAKAGYVVYKIEL